jgi:hypothetical protein
MRLNEDGEIDLLDKGVRAQVLSDINQEDNHNRKRDQQKRYDVYHGRQDVYILERLRKEFSQKTVDEMRKILSINLAKRIIDEKSSVYTREPERTFYTKSGADLTDAQTEQLEALYRFNNVDTALALTNVAKNRHDQCALMCVPDKMGGFKVRAVSPIHYDVIPSNKDPEKAYAYIISVWDKDLRGTVRSGQGEPTQLNQYKGNDRTNQSIADDDDARALHQRFVVWTAKEHFIMNGGGKIQGEIMPNPIKMLPFIDVAPAEKDFQFFVRRGSNTIDFSLDYGMLLSDNANVIRLQSYSQAVISSEKLPTNMTVGPNHILHLKLDPNRPELSPRFEFVTPNPDLAGTQSFMESMLNLHLTSEGQDPSILSTTNSGQKFNSGLDRLLSMISKFEATRDDFALFRKVEDQLVRIMGAWSNEYQNVVGDGELDSDLKIATLPDDVMVDVKFSEPEAIQTRAEQEDSIIKLIGEGLMSRLEAVMELRGVNEDEAKRILEDIDGEDFASGAEIIKPMTEVIDDGSSDIQEE